jgi:hypothetical protein
LATNGYSRDNIRLIVIFAWKCEAVSTGSHMSGKSGQTIAVIDSNGASVSTIRPAILEWLSYLSEQTGLPFAVLVEAAVALFIARTAPTLGPPGFLPNPKTDES